MPRDNLVSCDIFLLNTSRDFRIVVLHKLRLQEKNGANDKLKATNTICCELLIINYIIKQKNLQIFVKPLQTRIFSVPYNAN